MPLVTPQDPGIRLEADAELGIAGAQGAQIDPALRLSARGCRIPSLTQKEGVDVRDAVVIGPISVELETALALVYKALGNRHFGPLRLGLGWVDPRPDHSPYRPLRCRCLQQR